MRHVMHAANRLKHRRNVAHYCDNVKSCVAYCASAAALATSPLPFPSPILTVSMVWHRRDAGSPSIACLAARPHPRCGRPGPELINAGYGGNPPVFQCCSIFPSRYIGIRAPCDLKPVRRPSYGVVGMNLRARPGAGRSLRQFAKWKPPGKSPAKPEG
jgi:hypothetical protein